MKHLKFVSLLSILSFSLVGCIGLYDYYPPDDPQYIYNYAGEWTGSLKEQASEARAAEVSVTILPHQFNADIDKGNYTWDEYNYSLKGTWSSQFNTNLDAVGIFQGSSSAYSPDFSAYLTFGDDPDCSIEVNATRIGNSITGTYQPNQYNSSQCSFSDIKVGTFQITKQ